MESNKSKVDDLLSMRAVEINAIYEKYATLLNSLHEEFTVAKLNDRGWYKSDFYPAGNQFLFKKGNVEIRVYPKDLKEPISLMSYWDNPSISFVDMAHLEDYYNSKQ